MSTCPHCHREIHLSAVPNGASVAKAGRKRTGNTLYPDMVSANIPLPLWASCEMRRCKSATPELAEPPDAGVVSDRLRDLIHQAVRQGRIPASPPPAKWYHLESRSYQIGGITQPPLLRPDAKTKSGARMVRKYIVCHLEDTDLADNFRALCARAKLTVSAAIVRIWAYAAHGVPVEQWARVEEDEIDTARTPVIKKEIRCDICKGRGFAPCGDPAAKMCPRCVPWAKETPQMLWDLIPKEERAARKAAYLAAPVATQLESEPESEPEPYDIDDILGIDDPAPPVTGEYVIKQGDLTIHMPAEPLVEPADPLAAALAEYEAYLRENDDL